MNGCYQNLGARCNATVLYRNVMREGSAILTLAPLGGIAQASRSKREQRTRLDVMCVKTLGPAYPKYTCTQPSIVIACSTFPHFGTH